MAVTTQRAAGYLLLVVACTALTAGRALAGCLNPMGNATYRLGEGPTAHARRLAPSKKWQDINAVDFLAPAGTPLIAIVNGTVCDPAVNSACVVGKTKQEMRDPFSLNSFYLDGVDGQQYYYTHLERVLVKPGQKVTQGQRVATVGAYRGRNPHLHLAIKTGVVCSILTKCSPVDNRACR